LAKNEGLFDGWGGGDSALTITTPSTLPVSATVNGSSWAGEEVEPGEDWEETSSDRRRADEVSIDSIWRPRNLLKEKCLLSGLGAMVWGERN
jgi:hypothetical protein